MPKHDPVAEWDRDSQRALDAAWEEGALDQDVSLSRGMTPASQYLTELIADSCIHSWDLGIAIGVNSDLPADLVEFVYGTVQNWGDLSQTGVFKAAVPQPDGASTFDKLLGITGRDPNWHV
jgi:uncharacterized protein (TIGR03086 family)